MATHFRIPAWRTPRTEEPGRLRSTGLQTVGHDCATHSFKTSSTSTRIKPTASAAADLQSSPERSSGWRADMRHSVLWTKKQNKTKKNLAGKVFK